MNSFNNINRIEAEDYNELKHERHSSIIDNNFRNSEHKEKMNQSLKNNQLKNKTKSETSFDIVFSNDWIVNETIRIVGKTILLKGNLIVNSTGNITIENSILMFNSSWAVKNGNLVEDALQIRVLGGKAIFINSTISVLVPFVELSYNQIRTNYFTIIAEKSSQLYFINNELKHLGIIDGINSGINVNQVSELKLENCNITALWGILFANNTDRIVINNCELNSSLMGDMRFGTNYTMITLDGGIEHTITHNNFFRNEETNSDEYSEEKKDRLVILNSKNSIISENTFKQAKSYENFFGLNVRNCTSTIIKNNKGASMHMHLRDSRNTTIMQNYFGQLMVHNIDQLLLKFNIAEELELANCSYVNVNFNIFNATQTGAYNIGSRIFLRDSNEYVNISYNINAVPNLESSFYTIIAEIKNSFFYMNNQVGPIYVNDYPDFYEKVFNFLIEAEREIVLDYQKQSINQYYSYNNQGNFYSSDIQASRETILEDINNDGIGDTAFPVSSVPIIMDEKPLMFPIMFNNNFDLESPTLNSQSYFPGGDNYNYDTIYASVTDNFMLATIVVAYDIGLSGSWTFKTMTKDELTEQFNVRIPKLTQGIQQYYFIAYDIFGNKLKSEIYTYKISISTSESSWRIMNSLLGIIFLIFYLKRAKFKKIHKS
ncbi:MAG: hypothetical protein ACTSQE_10640 [Candidatus Heimdallarchaeaceae archaeon]